MAGNNPRQMLVKSKIEDSNRGVTDHPPGPKFTIRVGFGIPAEISAGGNGVTSLKNAAISMLSHGSALPQRGVGFSSGETAGPRVVNSVVTAGPRVTGSQNSSVSAQESATERSSVAPPLGKRTRSCPAFGRREFTSRPPPGKRRNVDPGTISLLCNEIFEETWAGLQTMPSVQWKVMTREESIEDRKRVRKRMQELPRTESPRQEETVESSSESSSMEDSTTDGSNKGSDIDNIGESQLSGNTIPTVKSKARGAKGKPGPSKKKKLVFWGIFSGTAVLEQEMKKTYGWDVYHIDFNRDLAC